MGGGETTERLWRVGGTIPPEGFCPTRLPPQSGQLVSQYKTLQQDRHHSAPCCLNQRGPTRKARRGGCGRWVAGRGTIIL